LSEGIIFDLQRFCTHDGPGIRTTVFLKGCPLDCAWCHNPESKSLRPEVLFSDGLCIRCGACAEACAAGAHVVGTSGHRFDRGRCQLSLHCVEACPSGALQVAGRTVTVEDVLAEVEKDRVFYEESGGGLTLSGGEPLAQFEFTRDVLRAARSAGAHTCVETSGHGAPEHYAELAPLVDLFLWDLKDTDAQRYRANTGVAMEHTLDNLRRVDALGGATILRCLLIPEVNLTAEHLDGIGEVYRDLQHCAGVELLAYHPLGQSKLARLGKHVGPAYRSPTSQELRDAALKLQIRGTPTVPAPEA
jgi:glycyl-radical enzyme activating protein